MRARKVPQGLVGYSGARGVNVGSPQELLFDGSVHAIDHEGVTLILYLGGLRHDVDVSTFSTAREVFARLAKIDVNGRTIPKWTREELATKWEANRRKATIEAIRSWREKDIAEALKQANRKGWALDGMSVAKLREILSFLRTVCVLTD